MNRSAAIRAALVLAAFLAAASINFIAHYRVPVVRNAVVYGHIVHNLMDKGGDFRAAQDAYNKPLGFAYLSLPWVKLWGANVGLNFSSFVFCLLWTASLVPFYNRFAAVYGLGRDRLWLFLLLTLWNPLTVYQAVSAYPDLLFALSFLWAFVFLERFLSPASRWYDGPAFSAATLFAVWVKHNGFVLFAVLVLFLVMRRKEALMLWRRERLHLAAALMAMAAVLLVIGAALRGHDFGLFNFSRNTENFLGGKTSRVMIMGGNFGYFLGYLGLVFNFMTPFIFLSRKRFKQWRLFLALILAGLLYYHGTRSNIRYYLAVSPFLSFMAAAATERLSAAALKRWVAAFVVLGGYLILYYNSMAFYDAASRILPLPRHDNLRLTWQQKDALQNVNLINSLHRRDGYDTLIFVSPYYGDSEWGVWERSGLFDPGLRVVYTKYWQPAIHRRYPRAIIYDNSKRLHKSRAVKGLLRGLTPKVFTADPAPRGGKA